MNRKTTSLILTVLVLSPSFASLASIDESVREEYQNARDNYLDAVDVFTNLRSAWVDARGLYVQYRDEGNLSNARAKARDYLTQGINAIDALLIWGEVRVENSQTLNETEIENILNRISSYHTSLQTLNATVQSATTAVEFISVASIIRSEWLDVRATFKNIMGIILSSRVNYVIGRLEIFGERVENRVYLLEDNGVDTTDMQVWLDDFESKIENAKQSRNDAIIIFNQISNWSDALSLFNQANSYLTNANNYLRTAYQDLKDIIQQMRESRGMIRLNGTSHLYASGNGTAEIRGEGVVSVLTAEGAILTFTDHAGDGTRLARGIGNVTELGNNSYLYQGTGSARFTGTDIEVILNGENIVLTARGTGTAILTGTGYYYTGSNPRVDWTSMGVSVEVSAE